MKGIEGLRAGPKKLTYTLTGALALVEVLEGRAHQVGDGVLLGEGHEDIDRDLNTAQAAVGWVGQGLVQLLGEDGQLLPVSSMRAVLSPGVDPGP